MRSRPGIASIRGIPRWAGFGLLLLFTAPLLGWIAARGLIVTSDLPHADALVVLAGSATYLERTRHAAKLFNEGRAPRVVLTNDNLKGGWSHEEERNPFQVELSANELKRLGVPADRIVILSGTVSTTYEEAVRIRDFADAQKLRSVLIVTSAYQSRRALWTMRRTFQGSSTAIGLDVVEPGAQSPRPWFWWGSRLGWKMVPGEYLKIAYYRLKY